MSSKDAKRSHARVQFLSSETVGNHTVHDPVNTAIGGGRGGRAIVYFLLAEPRNTRDTKHFRIKKKPTIFFFRHFPTNRFYRSILSSIENPKLTVYLFCTNFRTINPPSPKNLINQGLYNCDSSTADLFDFGDISVKPGDS